MIDKDDFKYCNLNEASKGIFPTYFLLDLNLTEQQKAILNKLITFLTDIKIQHTPPPPKQCETCGHTQMLFTDTWWIGNHTALNIDINFYKSLLEPNRISGNHT